MSQAGNYSANGSGSFGSTYPPGEGPPVQENAVSRAKMEKKARNEGLQQAISSDNKGFAMLQKMGYKVCIFLCCMNNDYNLSQ